ncbi:MAG: menaquinone biosynthesis protein, partial [Aquificaceae bacterium]|nr:menaquinone biosynthesis protein [Aquificaceae bacterium]
DTTEVELVEGRPAQLVQQLREGAIQAGIVSSVEYLQNPQSYRLTPGVSVSCLKKACSVLIFSRKPIRQVSSLYLTPASLTSRALALYLFRKLYNSKPKTVEDRDLAEGVLLIGDEALREKFSARWTFVYDLGELWHSLHGLPFVFALFLVRRDAPEGLEVFISEQCQRSKKAFFEDLQEGRVRAGDYPEPFLKEYFTSCLDYGLDRRALQSLETFAEALKELHEEWC